MKQNCWEVNKCGREPGGPNVQELGICPASTATKADGIHDGKNGGRCCWAVAGTLCGGREQGTYAKKYHECLNCEFYQGVQEEEGKNYIFITDILKILR